jgi:DNA-binding NtrC family response regulator
VLEEVLRESGVADCPPARWPADGPGQGTDASPEAALRPLAEQVAELEQRAIEAAMAATSGNKLAAARLLGISRAKLYERLESTA